MKTPIDIFCGSPLEIESEILFLDDLTSTLEAWGQPAVICANFLTERDPHQIDFLVITGRCACHVELKHLTAPVLGKVNGRWELQLPDGRPKTLDGNPYRQALDAKYAISDAMHDFAKITPDIPRPPNNDKFFKTFESVVCVSPKVLPGSQVPSDFRVRVMGFDEFLQFLSGRELNPGWSSEQWIGFAMYLGLVRRESEEPAARTANALKKMVDDYRERCETFLTQDLHALVPSSVSGSGGPLMTGALADFLSRREHAQFVGESGCGKSHLLRHMTLAELRSGGLVLFVAARDYEDRLSSLLNRSVAHLHPGTATELLEAAEKTGTRVSLVLDGFNECPPRLRLRLLKDLQSLLLRWPVPVVITAQEPAKLPKDMRGPVYRFVALTEEQRNVVLQSYMPAGSAVDALGVCDAFRTPYELSLAAEVLEELPGRPQRASLMDAYVRRRCERTSHPILVRHLLISLAQRMHEHLKSSLTQLEMWQVTEPLCERHAVTPQLVAELIDSGLLEVRRGRCSFRHELQERFLQAEALLRAHPDGTDLGQALRQPRSRFLAPAVLSLVSEVHVAHEVLRVQASSDILASCLIGDCGGASREAAVAECREALRAGFGSLDQLQLRVETVQTHGKQTHQVVGGVSLPSLVNAALFAVGKSLHSGMFLDQAFALAQQTDEACHTALERATGHPVTKALLHSLYFEHFVTSPGDRRPVLPSAIVYHGSRLFFRESTGSPLVDVLRRMLGTLANRTPAELFLFCNLLQSHHAAVPELVPELLRTSWATGLYNLRLEALHVAETAGRALSGDLREQVKALLESFRPRNLFLSTAVVEAMISYDMVQSPVSEEQAAAEIAEILDPKAHEQACRAAETTFEEIWRKTALIPSDAEAGGLLDLDSIKQQHESAIADFKDVNKRAYRAVGNIFEEIYLGSYWTAIDALSPSQRERLLTKAALGADEYATNVDWILRELLDKGGLDSLAAFSHWAVFPKTTSFSSQEATNCFLCAIIGCARFVDRMPDLGRAMSDDHSAWALYGEILFWMFKPGISKDQLLIVCKPLWYRLLTELPFQAVDPLERFSSAGWRCRSKEDMAIATLLRTFPDEMRSVLEFGLKNHGRLTSLFTYPPFDGYLGFLTQSLECVGSLHTVSLLESLLDSSQVGEAAAKAIRAIRSRY
ncbi:MAG TPA: NERD domain-containing protein [Gemmataceae bacterium]|nr:NERD domain-containing protein [Gemmataceae bacterium]